MRTWRINQIDVPDYKTKPVGFIETTFSNWYNPLAEYKYFFVPGRIGFIAHDDRWIYDGTQYRSRKRSGND